MSQRKLLEVKRISQRSTQVKVKKIPETRPSRATLEGRLKSSRHASGDDSWKILGIADTRAPRGGSSLVRAPCEEAVDREFGFD